MKRARQVWLLAFLICWMPPTAQARIFPWDDYGPACQWIRLSGEIERPEGMADDEPVWLTVTYRLPEQRSPATLLTNYPISKSRFTFILAGFDVKVPGAIFVSPMFFFSEKIEFQYFASLLGGKGRSEYRRVIYHPQRVKKDGQVLCQTGLQLGAIKVGQR